MPGESLGDTGEGIPAVLLHQETEISRHGNEFPGTVRENLGVT